MAVPSVKPIQETFVLEREKEMEFNSKILMVSEPIQPEALVAVTL